MNFIVEVTIFNETTGQVEMQQVRVYDGHLGFEVERLFDKLGEEIGRKVDPAYYDLRAHATNG